MLPYDLTENVFPFPARLHADKRYRSWRIQELGYDLVMTDQLNIDDINPNELVLTHYPARMLCSQAYA